MWNKTKSAAASLKPRPLAIVLLLVWCLACWWGTGIWRDKVATHVYDDARQRTERFFSTSIVGYERIIATRRGMIRVLGRDQTYRDALSRYSPLSAAGDEDERRRLWNADPRLAEVSRQLATAARDFGMRSIWLMDANGDCIAASNATEPMDHVGTRYADRNYFQAALAGRSAHQITIGRRQLGASISFSAPVTDRAGRVIGVLAGGNDLSTFTNWLDQADAFFTDRHGVVILSKDPTRNLSALPNAPVQSFDAATLQKLYKTSDIPTLSLPTQRDARFPELLRFTDGTAPVIFGSHPVTDGELVLHVLQPLPQLTDLGHRRAVNAGTLGLVGILLILLVASTLRRRREQHTMAQALVQREQRATQASDFLDQIINVVAEPLFVKDSEHRWIRVNQAFCKIHGQPRENFIGKFAHDVFPERIAQGIWDADERVLTAGIEIVAEEKLTDSHGVTHIVVTKKAPYTDAGGQRFIVGIISDITERKQVERLMRVREREFRSLAENLPVAVIRYDSECRRRYLNPSAEKMLHSSTSELLGLVPGGGGVPASPAMLQHYRSKMEEVLATDTMRELDFVLDELPADSQEHYEVRFVPEHDTDGKTIGVLAIWHDITKRKQLERLLRAREQEFRSLAENLPDVVIRYDRECRRIYVNQVLATMAGCMPDELLGQLPENYTPLADPERYMAELRQTMDEGKPRSLDVQVRRVGGELGWYQTSFVPEFDADGQVSGGLAVARDITGIKQAQAQMSHFVANFPGFAFSFHLSPDGHASFPFASPGIERLYGLRPQDVKNDMAPVHALAHPEDRPCIEAAIAESARAMTPFHIETRVCRPGLPERWIETRSMPLREADGSIVWHGLMIDITERKRMEQALKESAAQYRYQSNLLHSVLESAADVSVWALDRDYCYLSFNTKHRENSKRLRGGDIAVGTSPLDLIRREEFREVCRQAFDRVLAGYSICVEIREEVVQEGSLTYEYYEHYGSPIRNDEGEIVGLTLFTYNITARKAMEKAFRDSEQVLQEAQRIAHVGSWDVDMVNDKLTWSDEVFRIWEIEKTKFKADFVAFLETVHPDDRERVSQAYNDAVINHSLYEVEHRLLFPDGRVKHILERGEPQYDAQGQPVRFIGTALDITERKRMEETLTAREREFRSLAENLPDNITRWDVDGCYLYLNPVHERTLGVSANDMLGKAVPDSHTFVKAAIAQVVATGQVATLVRQSVVVDGETQIHEVSLAPEYDAEGHVVSVLGIGRDMTDIYRMQEAITAREQEFRSLAESSPDSIIRYDLDHRILYLNDLLIRDLELASDDEVIGKRPIEVWPDDRFAVIDEAAKRVIASGTAETIELVRTRDHGVTRVGQIVVVPERDVTGRIIGTLAFGRDITEIKQAEQALSASEALAQSRNDLLQAIVESSPEIIVFALDTDYRYLAFNQKHKEVMQAIWGKEIAIGMNMLDVIGDHPDRKAAQHGMDRALAGESFVLEEAYGNELLSRQYWLDYWSPIRSDAGNVIGVTCFVLNISEQKKAEVAVRESEEKLRSLYELSPLGIALTDMDGRYLEFNEAYRAICGYPADELKSLDYWTLTPREYEPQEAEQLQSLSLTGRYGPYEKEYLQKDGRRIPIQLNGTLVTGRDGQRHIWSIVENTTERKRAEVAQQENFDRITELNAHLEKRALELKASREQLELTEAWYRSILRSAPDGMLVTDRNGVIVQVNAQLEAMFGYEEKELIGNHVEILLPGAIRDMHVKKRIDFVTSGRVDRPMAAALHLRGCRKDGSEFPVDISLSQLPNIVGRVGAICVAIRDITSRRRMEDELQRGRLALKDAQRIGQIGSWEFDLVSGVLNWSDEALRMFEIAPALFGTSMDAFMNAVHPEDRERVSAAYDASIKNRTAYDVEHRLLFPDGRVKDVRERGETWYDTDGRPLRTLGTVQNITEAKLAEERLLKSRDIVRALAAHQETEHEKERRQLAHEIHEDLAQNLAALRLNITLFEMSDESAPRASVLKTMRFIADRSIARIRDIVSMLRPTVLDLGLVPALRWLTDDFKGVGFQFDLALPEDILLNDEESTFLFRATQEALLNIALHAAATHVHVSLDSVAGVCCLVVRDNGCGFDPAAPRREGSFGLIGLTEQARHLGGDLSIDSRLDQGTVLQIHLPGMSPSSP